MRISQRTSPNRLRACTTGFILGLGLMASASADDIDIYSSGIDEKLKPNILFVLDMSNSMEWDINGQPPSSTGLDSRYDILRGAVQKLLDQNASNVNAGISVYRNRITGILWPVSDLDGYAHAIDEAIPESDDLLSKDVIMGIINDQWVGSATATVGALAEAALYFKGGEVALGGIDPNRSGFFKPNTWDTGLELYRSGSYIAPNRAAYSPSDAFKLGVPNGETSTCNDYSNGGTTPGNNQCQNKDIVSCITESGGTYNEDGTTKFYPDFMRCTYNVPDTWSGANYISPITQECQSNFIVLISDGVPTHVQRPDLAPILGHSTSSCDNLNLNIFSSTSSTSTEGNCGPELAKVLHENDQVSTIAGSNVDTYTVGFSIEGAGQDYLKLIATEGGGQFFPADNAEQLSAALDSVVTNILGGNENFSALSVDINKASFSNDDRVFFSLFEPSGKQGWKGNLKGYFIDNTGIKDINNTLATVTDDTGTRFVDTAQSFWSANADGNEVTSGGASSQFDSSSRVIYTYTGGTLPDDGAELSRADDANLLHVDNDVLTTTLLGIADDADARAELLTWLHAAPMGDPLHTRSTTVKYPGQTLIFTMTNQGLLHAIDATSPVDPSASDISGGNEVFAFMPPELLGNLAALKANAAGDHIYGLDGGMTRWHEDDNNNGIVDGEETALLVFGMRRGGNNYYALDVSDPAKPVYKWTIQGGSHPFEKLAQSWSRMALVDVQKGDDTEKVLVFGGGYDAAMDEAVGKTAASGNSIYMIDKNATVIWSASDDDMNYSIPSDISVIDSDNDGLADRLYAADLGGQVWRVDFGNVSSSSNFNVSKFADLGTDSWQPFFYAPSIALNDDSSDYYISVALGSGNRTDPLAEDTQNRIFMIKDRNADSIPETGTAAYTTTDLYDATNNDIDSSNTTTATTATTNMDNADGWYIDLDNGEKSLTSLLTFEDTILATTFSPDSSGISTNSCEVQSSIGRYYAISVTDARPVEKFTALENTTDTPSAAPTKDDRRKEISYFGIPSSPVVLFPPGTSSVQVIVDKQAVQTIDQALHQVYWYPKK
ncbi:MAG: PilC/PilY family type IV pilus protein [Granulosicoccus sp.]